MEREYWFVIVSAFLAGVYIFGARVFAELGLSLYEFSILQGMFVLIFLPFIVLKKGWKIKKGMLKIFLLFGLFSAFSCFTEFGPVFLGVPVAITVLLLYTQPLWTTIFGRLFLKEDVTRHKFFAVILVVSGVVLLVDPFDPFNVTSFGSVPGVILALSGGVLLSAWIILGRIAGLKKYNPVTTTFGGGVFMLVFLVIFYPFIGLLVNDPSIMKFSLGIGPDIFFYLGLYSVFISSMTSILIFHGMKKVPASVSGIILLLEPIVASVLAAAFLIQTITLKVIAGGSLILVSNYLVIRKKEN